MRIFIHFSVAKRRYSEELNRGLVCTMTESLKACQPRAFCSAFFFSCNSEVAGRLCCSRAVRHECITFTRCQVWQVSRKNEKEKLIPKHLRPMERGMSYTAELISSYCICKASFLLCSWSSCRFRQYVSYLFIAVACSIQKLQQVCSLFSFHREEASLFSFFYFFY